MTQPRLAAILALAVLVLTAVVGAVGQARDAQRAGVTSVDAVVLSVDAGRPTTARVAWRTTDGRTGAARTAVPAGTVPGEILATWARRDGSLAASPAGPGSAAAVAVAVAVGTVAAGGVLAAHGAARARIRSRELADEWARVEPLWSRATGRTEP